MRTVRQVAHDLPAGEQTVYRWIRRGELRTTRPDGLHHLISDADLAAFKAARSLA